MAHHVQQILRSAAETKNFHPPRHPEKKAVTAKNVPSIPCPYRRYREAKRDEADDKTSFARPALKNWAVGLRRKARSVPTKYGIRWSSHIL